MMHTWTALGGCVSCQMPALVLGTNEPMTNETHLPTTCASVLCTLYGLDHRPEKREAKSNEKIKASDFSHRVKLETGSWVNSSDRYQSCIYVHPQNPSLV